MTASVRHGQRYCVRVSPDMSPTRRRTPTQLLPRCPLPASCLYFRCFGASLSPKVLGSIPSGGMVQEPGVCRASFGLAVSGVVHGLAWVHGRQLPG
jgi:hypothetical protein